MLDAARSVSVLLQTLRTKGPVMAITSLEINREALTVTILADFPVPVTRLWQAYMDPRQLERFWGPPSWPATFTRHDVRPGGRSEYHMTSPDGERSGGFWEFISIDPPHRFEVRDGFTHEDGTPNTELPGMRMVFEFSPSDSGSRLTTTTHFPSAEALEQLVEMGMLEGTREAMGQIDEVVTDDAAFDSNQPAQLDYLDDVTIRVSRVLQASPEHIWQAYHEPEIMQQWLLGPDGWRMPVCEIGHQPGDTYRYEWESDAGEDRFGFTGEILESDAPHREVATENMIGMEGPGTVNAMHLTEITDGTLLIVVITYPSQELRDIVVATGMVDGMELSYARLESQVL